VETTTLAARTRVARYAGSLAVLLLALAVLVLGDPRVCRQEVPPGASVPVAPVRVCAPPAATDTAVVAVLALVALLLAPDLGAACVGGLTLTRRVEEARADAAAARADVATLRLAVTGEQRVDVANRLHVNVGGGGGGAEVIAALSRAGLLTPGGAGWPPRARPEAYLLSGALSRLLPLLPEEWRDGALVGTVGAVAASAGERVPAEVWHDALRDPDGALARARHGDEVVVPRVGGQEGRAVVAVPAPMPGNAGAGAVAVILPAGVSASAAEARRLAPVAAAFAAALTELGFGEGRTGDEGR
jgi:hypothetical protein